MPPEATVEDHKKAFEAWISQSKGKIPHLNLLLPIGTNSESILLLPVARNGYHGLILDFDARRNGELLHALTDQAYSVVDCRTWVSAARFTLSYLED